MSSPVSLSDLPDFLQRQRWFGGKAWPLKSAEVLDYVVVGDVSPPFVLAVIEVTYEVGLPERYVLSVNETGAALEEALGRDATVQALFRMIRDGGRLGSASGVLFGEPTPGARFPVGDSPVVRRLAVDQTNTSVVLDEDVILKVIRKLEPGANPEVEIGRILTRKTSFTAMPELLGALQLDSQGPMTIGVLHRFVKDSVDGWRHVTAHLASTGAADAELIDALRALGILVGELHVALASVTDEPGFAPEPVLGDDLQRWSSSVVGELGVTLAQAQRVDATLEAHRERLVEKVRELAHAAPSGQRIRVHGDLHLGQVLRSEGRWLVFDFEGEPRRTFSQRREKTSALKDVAGMLRSLDYASAAVELSEETRAEFLSVSRTAFLKGYRKATRGSAFLPDDPEAMAVMLRVFELEKLLYELRYELANRPDWVHIPLAALKREEGIVPDDT